MTSPDPTLDLRQHLAAGEVTAFVGAGLSIGAGLPSWYDLIAELAAASATSCRRRSGPPATR